MNAPVFPHETKAEDFGLHALCGVAAYYRIPADQSRLRQEFALQDRLVGEVDLVRAAKHLGMKARIVKKVDSKRLVGLPSPALVRMRDGTFNIFGGRSKEGKYRLVDPVAKVARELDVNAVLEAIEGHAVLVARKLGGDGVDPRAFGFRWFLPSIWRHRKPLIHVLVASLFIQVFALITPLFFQIVIDKVLVQKTYATLIVLVVGLVVLGFFDILLQYLRTYALSHTTNRIDVELGQRLFTHLLRLPLSYFETRSTGQTVARVRELENIRTFLTGQGLFSAIDLLFTLIFVAVLFAYSQCLTLIVLCSVPIYMLIGGVVRPLLRDTINEKFHYGALSQQFLVETLVGIQTVKAGAVEPVMRVQWEEKLAAYVRTAFKATLQAALGTSAVQYVSKLTTAAILLFGAQAVMAGSLSVGGLIAFNMIAAQVIQPILRLSQLWQDFQQVQISVERLGDILNTPPEPYLKTAVVPNAPRGDIELQGVNFRYAKTSSLVLKNVSVAIRPGEVVGIVGPSGSGKSTLTKLIQRLYIPEDGRILVDGFDISTIDPVWLRSQIGVVLQDSLLFNRSIHDNISFANPSMSRRHVINMATLAGADKFINDLSDGYDTILEERGSNLSGGQRQRIAIARALATNPKVLIFDEATSALDYESERIIQENMKSIVAGRTVIIIAHRLAAVRRCDRILGMHGGRIVESGSHNELVGRPSGLYSQLWKLQNEQIEGAA